jgi:hypothetical protein
VEKALNMREAKRRAASPLMGEARRQAMAAAPQPAANQGIQPQPVPTQFTVMQRPGPDGGLIIELVVATPIGPAHYFMPSDIAAQVGKRMVDLATAATSNLIIVGGQ